MRRHELSDEQWALIAPLLPKGHGRGGQWKEHRRILNGMFWRLRTGAPWRDIPERYGAWKTIYDRFNRYRREGLLDGILEALQVRLDRDGLIDWDLWCIDGTTVRATRAAAGGGSATSPAGRSPRRTTRSFAAATPGPSARSSITTCWTC